jgi:Mg-chelatase subunit ChlD
MMLTVEHPWLLAFLPVGVVYLLWLWRKSYVRLPPWQQRLTLALRTLLVVVLGLVIAYPVIVRPNKMPPVVALLDVSDSVPDEVLAREQALIASAWRDRGDRSFDVVTFAEHPRWVSARAGAPKLERHDSGGTDLEAAIQFGSGLRAEGRPRLVLFSDGNETRGDARRAVGEVARRGVSLDVVDDAAPSTVDARVVGLRPASLVRRGEPTRIGVFLEATRPGPAHLELREDGLLVDRREVTLAVGSQAVEIDLVPSRAGFVRFEATVQLPGDSVQGNDRYERVFSVVGEPRVLICSSTVDEGRHLEEAFRANDLDVEAISLQLFPSSLEGLSSYDAVVLAGIAPFDLDRLRQAALTSYVRDLGGGLLFVAGPNGLKRAPTGATNTVDLLLPVEPATPSERQIPPVAIVLLIDRSGSMVGEKLTFAKQAALAVVDKLSENAQVGVIAFDAGFDWILPLQPLDDKKAIAAKISALGAGGGTRFYPALEDAYYALGNSDAAAKHLILLTDGNSTDPTQLPAWLQRIAERHITVSTVAIGRSVDEKMLREIARVGAGRFHQTTRASEVPTIFVEEAKTVERDAVQNNDTKAYALAPTRELAGIDFTTAPALKGYVRAKAKLPTAEVLLESQRHDPLLVRWRYGLGVVTAFTSDATARWATEWLRWTGFGKLWTQLLRGTQKTRIHQEVTLNLKDEGETLGVAAEAIDATGHFLNDLTIKAVILDGAQQRYEISLPQVGPGQYAARIESPKGSLLVKPIASLRGRPLDGDWTVLPRPYPAELLRIGSDHRRLAELARLGGGDVLRLPNAPTAALDLLAGQPGRSLPRPTPLATPLGLFALVLFLLDVAMKRGRFGSRS